MDYDNSEILSEIKLPLFAPPPYCRQVKKNIYDQEEYEENPSLNLTISNPSRILQLCERLTNDSSKDLEIKINKYLIREGECETAFVIHLLPCSMEALVQTIGEEQLEKSLRYPISEKVFKNLISYDNNFIKCDGQLDPQIIDILNGTYKKLGRDFTLIPIVRKKYKYFPCATENLQPAMLVCLVNSKRDENYITKLTEELFRYCQTVLLNTLAGEEQVRQKKQYQSLLATVQNFLICVEDVNDLFRKIVFEAKNITNAKYGSLFLLDPEKVCFSMKIFNLLDKINCTPKVKLVEDEEIAKYVVATRKLLNIKSSDSGPLIDNKRKSNVHIRNILCFPVEDKDAIIGVILLCNKRNGDFNFFDEEATKTLSIYCGLSISHCLSYKELKETLARSRLSNTLLVNHIEVTNEQLERQLNCQLIHMHPDIEQFHFSPHTIVGREKTCFIFQMFEQLGFVEEFSFKRNHLFKFIIMVQKCYGDAPYHNWDHAFSSVHFGYLALKKLELVEKGYLSTLEALAYLISCLCHNLDYKGVNNPFQEKPLTNLASLYSSPQSVMERHHLFQTLAIINTDGCNFLDSLNCKDYRLCLDLVKDLILATDLATHFKLYSKQYNLTEEGYDKDDPEHRYLLSSLLLTCASFADHLKEWTDVRQTVAEMFEELLILGYVEKEIDKDAIYLKEYKIKPPDMQIEFLRNICWPVFKMLAILFPSANELVSKVKRNILYWESSKHVFNRLMRNGQMSCNEILRSDDLQTSVEKTLKLLEQNNKKHNYSGNKKF